MAADMNRLCMIQRRFHLLAALDSNGRKYALKRSLPGFQGILKADAYAAILKAGLSVGYRTYDLVVHIVQILKCLRILCTNLQQNVAHSIVIEGAYRQLIIKLHAEMVAEGHSCRGCSNTVAVECVACHCNAGAEKSCDLLIQLNHAVINRNVILILLNREANQEVSRCLQLRCHNFIDICHVHRKGNQCRRNINVVSLIFIGSGHRVLAADGGNAVSDLCIVSTEKCRKRLAPALRIHAHAPEEFLEGKMKLLKRSAACNDLCNRLRHRIDGTVVRAPA